MHGNTRCDTAEYMNVLNALPSEIQQQQQQQTRNDNNNPNTQGKLLRSMHSMHGKAVSPILEKNTNLNFNMCTAHIYTHRHVYVFYVRHTWTAHRQHVVFTIQNDDVSIFGIKEFYRRYKSNDVAVYSDMHTLIHIHTAADDLTWNRTYIFSNRIRAPFP